MPGRSPSPETLTRPRHTLYALTFALGLVMAIVAIGAMLELRSRMVVAFGAFGTVNALQASRARSVAYLIDAQGASREDAHSADGPAPAGKVGAGGRFVEDLAALQANASRERQLKPFVDKYVLDANAALAALKSAPIDDSATGVVSQDLATARRSSDQLDLALTESVGAGREALEADISAMILAVGALIAGIAMVSLTQGWELLAMGRRLFTTQSDSAARIASLSTTLSESREALAQVHRRLTLAMRSAHVAVFSIEPTGTVTWSLDAGSGVLGGLPTPFLLSDLTPVADRARVLKRVIDASRSRDVVEFEMKVERTDLDLSWVKVTLLPLDAADESDLLGSAVDITDIKRREEGNVLLMRELSHRSKNLLAVVQAMARQTARTAGSPIEFYERFGARLRALAAGHDLLVKSVYVSAELEELMRTQIGALAPLIGSRVSAEGPLVRLRPEATQNLGMALHELAANAQIHGAMTNPLGRIDIRWKLEGRGANGRLMIDWVESGGPRIAPPTRRGFGSTLILENLPRSLHGVVTLEHAIEGTRCHMDFPLSYTLESWKPDESIGDLREASGA